MQETHCKQNQVALDFELAVRDFFESSAAGNRIFHPLQTHGFNTADPSFAVGQKLLRGNRIVPFTAFFLRGRGTHNGRPIRPNHRLIVGFRRLRTQVDLQDLFCTLTNRGAKAVTAGVAAADDQNLSIFGTDIFVKGLRSVVLILYREVFEREVNTFEITAFHLQISRRFGTHSKHDD